MSNSEINSTPSASSPSMHTKFTQKGYTTFVDKEQFIINKVHTDLTVEILKEMILEDQEIINKTGIHKVLSDVRGVTNKINYIQDYQLVKESKSTGLLARKVKIAILCALDDNSFYSHETFALNVGYNIKIFKAHKAAIYWLNL